MDRFFAYTRQLADGTPVGGATITVYDAGTLDLAAIYSDDNAVPTPRSNPFLADTNGLFFFYAVAGRYDVRISEGGPTPIPTPYTWGDVVLGETHLKAHVLATISGLGPDHSVSGLTSGHVLVATSATTAAFQSISAAGVITDHGVLNGLLDDDHSQYPLLLGRTTGQVLRGGADPVGSLELDGTLSATKGPILLNKAGGNVGIGVAAPASLLEVAGTIHSTAFGFKFPDDTIQITASAPSGTEAWTIVGNDIYTANLGNVGINTVTPLRRLHVQGGPTDNELLRLAAISGRSAEAEFLAGGTTALKISADTTSCGLFNGDGTGTIRINQSTGYVSMGPSSAPASPNPSMPLYISAITGVDDTVGLDAALGEEASVNFLAAGDRFGRLGGNALLIGMDCRVADAVTGNVSLKASNGYCGIGTIAPLRRLHVSGTTSPIMRLETDSGGVELELFDGSLEELGYLGATPSGGFTYFSNGAKTGNVVIRQETGYVGIVPDFGGFGADPARPLEIESLASVSVQLRLRARAPGGAGLELYSGAARQGGLLSGSAHVILENQTGGTESLALDQTNGNVSIGNFAATEKLDVTGNVHAASHTTSSDERFKKDVKPLEGVLEKVCQLRGVRYCWNDFYKNSLGRGADASPGEVHIGLIAQEVLPLFPELVRPWYTGDQPAADDPHGNHYYGLYYDRFVPLLIEAVKELRGEIQVLRKEAVDT